MSTKWSWFRRLILIEPQIEREMGSTGFLITYLAAGTFGYGELHFENVAKSLTNYSEMSSVVTLHEWACLLWVPAVLSLALSLYDFVPPSTRQEILMCHR